MNNAQFVMELSKLRPNSTFLSLKGYLNDHGEVADYNMIFHISYENALKKSIQTLSEMKSGLSDLEKQARFELLDSFAKSLAKINSSSVEEIDDAYQRFFDENGNHIKGVKLHRATNALHLYGLVHHKRILMPGMYTKTNKKPLTQAKDRLRRLTPVGKFRQFIILPDRVDSVSVENLSLLPPE